ncbi:24.1 kDa heat shock protein, mitochondrial-like [Triticum dicoccoides]|uniref:Small heat shock protein Hsp23.5 n=1 Tax=Triticum aestivum TaxID=4565 RepID=Q9ZP25_WHEAT|nr:24.1 kDa heat shock protein, mitochondrial-like [Triticum dicoccoides]AAD03604.1 small heat shock protein Hsp23.5 [Triticum aestivum]
MASRVVFSNRIPLVRAMENLLAASSGSALRPAAVAGGVRGYNAGAPLRSYDRDEAVEDTRRVARERDIGVPSFFSDVFRDPFSAPQSLGRLLSMLDDVAAASPDGAARAAPMRRGWNAREDADALRLRVDMPGLGKEHVKVWAEQNSLVIKGEGEKESEQEGADAPRYSGRLELAGDVYRMDQIKAEMKNGVLRVVVPKVKEEHRKDVFEVNVD